MKEFAKLSYCVIKYIEKEKLEESIGTGPNEPSIKYLKDGAELDTQPSANNDLKEFNQACNGYAKKFRDILAA